MAINKAVHPATISPLIDETCRGIANDHYRRKPTPVRARSGDVARRDDAMAETACGLIRLDRQKTSRAASLSLEPLVVWGRGRGIRALHGAESGLIGKSPCRRSAV